MPSGWSQRRAWAVWTFASLVGWVAIAALLTISFTPNQNMIADDVDLLAPSNLAPASGPAERAEPRQPRP